VEVDDQVDGEACLDQVDQVWGLFVACYLLCNNWTKRI
jgi:hypothetical protein